MNNLKFSDSATLEFKINETHKIHGLILRRMEEIKQRQFDSEEFLKVSKDH